MKYNPTNVKWSLEELKNIKREINLKTKFFIETMSYFIVLNYLNNTSYLLIDPF